MYVTLTKPTFTRWRSTPTANLSKLVKSLKKRRGKIAVWVPCVVILLLLSKFAFKSKRHAIRHPPPEVDPTTEACYDYLRSSSSSSSNLVRRDHDFLRRYECLVDQGEWLLEEGLVNAAGIFEDPPQDFGSSPFNRNGWSVVNNQEPLPLEWDEVFQGPLSGISPEEEFPYVRLDQNRRFNNDYHSNVDVSQPFEKLHPPVSDLSSPYTCLRPNPRHCEPQLAQPQNHVQARDLCTGEIADRPVCGVSNAYFMQTNTDLQRIAQKFQSAFMNPVYLRQTRADNPN